MKLKELIDERLDITVTDFARKIGVTRQTIHGILRGEGNPRLLTVKKICKYFGVDYKDYI
jgi:DNA-binding XRE family transcriptional regulator